MNRESELILVINPGSTSTKAALFCGSRKISSVSLEHTAEELAQYSDVLAQKGFRKEAVLGYLQQEGVLLTDLAAIAARCGAVVPLESGAYLVNERLIEAVKNSDAPHPANLAPIIAYEFCCEAGGDLTAYIYDGVSCMGTPEEIYQITGIEDFEKPFYTHVLNSKAVAWEQARREGAGPEDRNYIVAHLGGGITVNLLQGGRIIDFVGDDEGAFSPERSGGLPVRRLVDLCYSGKYTREEMQKLLKGRGGFMSYLGTNDSREVERRIEDGDEKARLIYEAMALQISKDIASLTAVVSGKVDRIILTGGMAHSKALIEKIRMRVGFLAPIAVLAGTFEMEALAGGILRVLRGEEEYRFL